MQQKNNNLPRVKTSRDYGNYGLWILAVAFVMFASFKVGTICEKHELQPQIDTLTEKLKNANGSFYKSVNVKVTSYQPTIEQCDSTPFLTASGHRITDSSYYKTCAVSKDLLYSVLNFNDIIKLEINGKEYNLLVTDIVQGSKHVDLLCPVNAKWKDMPQGNGIVKYKIK